MSKGESVKGRFLCGLGLLLILALGDTAGAAPLTSCTFKARPTDAYRAAGGQAPAKADRRSPLRGTVCERATGARGMEPMLGVGKRGTMFMGIATEKGLYEQPGELTGTAKNALLRSRDGGRKWARIPLPGGINSSEGFPYVEIVRAVFEAMTAGDMDALRELYDPDVIVRTVKNWPEPGPYVGREAAVRFFEQLRDTWDAPAVVPVSDFIDARDRVAVRYVWRGAGHGPDLNMELTLVFTMRRGRIVYQEFFWDHAEALEAAGVSE